MLFDEEEIEIMSEVGAPSLRASNPVTERISRRIFNDFFTNINLAGTRIIELGPGQYDFARIAETSGANITAMDFEPAVIALGRKRGYSVILADFRTFNWEF